MDYKVFFEEIKKEYIRKNIKFHFDYDAMLDDLRQEGIHLLGKASKSNPGICPERVYFNNYYAKNVGEFLSFIAFKLLLESGSVSEFIENGLVLSFWNNPWLKKFCELRSKHGS